MNKTELLKEIEKDFNKLLSKPENQDKETKTVKKTTKKDENIKTSKSVKKKN